MLAAGIAYLGTQILLRGAAGFARVNIVIVTAAIFVAVLLLREYRRQTEAVVAPVPDVASAKGSAS